MKRTVSSTLRLLLLFVLPPSCALQIDLGSNDGGAAGGDTAGGMVAGGTVGGGSTGGGSTGGGSVGGGSVGGGSVGGGSVGGGSADGGTAGGSTGGGFVSDGGAAAFGVVDRTRLEFGEDYGEGVAVGMVVTETLQLRNAGALPLTFSVSFTGAPLFTVDSLPIGGSVPPHSTGFVRVRFGPADGGWTGPTSSFTGALQLTTTAPNLPSLSIPVSAKAVKP